MTVFLLLLRKKRLASLEFSSAMRDIALEAVDEGGDSQKEASE